MVKEVSTKMYSKSSSQLFFHIDNILATPYIHSFIFSVYPILFLYSYNITELLPSVLWFPISLSLLFRSTLAILFFILYRDKYRSSFMTTLVLLTFFSYSKVVDYLAYGLDLIKGGRLSFYVIVGAIFMVAFYVKVKNFELTKLTKFLNITAFILFTIVLTNIVPYEISVRNSLTVKVNNNDSLNGIKLSTNVSSRDIYYIVLDSYGRQDVLKNYFDFDNTSFINSLKDRGFYVASESTSNYAYTHLSLPSTFNYEYLNDMTLKYEGKRSAIDPVLNKMFHENKTTRFLQTRGYQFINFDSGWWFTQEIPTADLNIRSGKLVSFFGKYINSNDFTNVLLTTTALSPFVKEKITESMRDRILFNFSKIAELSYERQNKFVIAHFVLPHPPYLFDKDGGTLSGEIPSGFDKKLEIDQLQYTNHLIIDLVDKILSRSSTKPIIIIASDHGPLIRELDGQSDLSIDEVAKIRMSNLNAYYFPNGGQDLLYESITPVNTFRILFNYYFGSDHEILEDKNYFSWGDNLYKFYDITDKLRE